MLILTDFEILIIYNNNARIIYEILNLSNLILYIIFCYFNNRIIILFFVSSFAFYFPIHSIYCYEYKF